MTPYIVLPARVLALWLVMLLLLGVLLVGAARAQTATEKAACYPDAVRLCGVTDKDKNASLIRITAVAWCLFHNRDKLSKGCRAAFAAHGM